MSFSSDIRRYAEIKKQSLEKVVRASIIDLSSRVILRTPVDTGRLRANWQASLDTPEKSSTMGTDKTGAQAIDRTTQVSARAAGHVFYLVNNLSYASAVEFGQYGDGPKTVGGFSKQAPRGMLRVSVQEFQQLLRKAVAEVK